MDRTAWMAGKYGLMVHWLFPGVVPEKGTPARTLDEAVDRFNIPRFMNDFAATGAEWLIFTLGQNTGCYASPNAVIETLTGKGHCAGRDLALEIAAGVHALGKRFIAYLPCELAANVSLHWGFAWETALHTAQSEFQWRYTRAVAEWSTRFGALLDGWWFDGCYPWPVFHSSRMNWPLWFEAARAGNAQAAVAFNDGSFCIGEQDPVHAGQDYLSGETEILAGRGVRLGRDTEQAGHLPEGRFVAGFPGCQWHALLPIDCFWMHGSRAPDWLPGCRFQELPAGATSAPMEPPVYVDDELARFLDGCLPVGGAVTLNAGIYEEGHLGEATVRQLRHIRDRRQV